MWTTSNIYLVSVFSFYFVVTILFILYVKLFPNNKYLLGTIVSLSILGLILGILSIITAENSTSNQSMSSFATQYGCTIEELPALKAVNPIHKKYVEELNKEEQAYKEIQERLQNSIQVDNFEKDANVFDGTCELKGCMNITSVLYDSRANVHVEGMCLFFRADVFAEGSIFIGVCNVYGVDENYDIIPQVVGECNINDSGIGTFTFTDNANDYNNFKVIARRGTLRDENNRRNQITFESPFISRNDLLARNTTPGEAIMYSGIVCLNLFNTVYSKCIDNVLKNTNTDGFLTTTEQNDNNKKIRKCRDLAKLIALQICGINEDDLLEKENESNSIKIDPVLKGVNNKLKRRLEINLDIMEKMIHHLDTDAEFGDGDKENAMTTMLDMCVTRALEDSNLFSESFTPSSPSPSSPSPSSTSYTPQETKTLTFQANAFNLNIDIFKDSIKKITQNLNDENKFNGVVNDPELDKLVIYKEELLKEFEKDVSDNVETEIYDSSPSPSHAGGAQTETLINDLAIEESMNKAFDTIDLLESLDISDILTKNDAAIKTEAINHFDAIDATIDYSQIVQDARETIQKEQDIVKAIEQDNNTVPSTVSSSDSPSPQEGQEEIVPLPAPVHIHQVPAPSSVVLKDMKIRGTGAHEDYKFTYDLATGIFSVVGLGSNKIINTLSIEFIDKASRDAVMAQNGTQVMNSLYTISDTDQDDGLTYLVDKNSEVAASIRNQLGVGNIFVINMGTIGLDGRTVYAAFDNSEMSVPSQLFKIVDVNDKPWKITEADINNISRVNFSGEAVNSVELTFLNVPTSSTSSIVPAPSPSAGIAGGIS